MDRFEYRDGRLWCEGVSVERIARDAGTPVYVYSSQTFLDHFRKIRAAFEPLQPLICFSIKSCSNLAILSLLKEAGSGFDVVSGGELYRALRVGADPSKIVFAGVAKTDREIVEAIDAGIGWFNVESEAEMENLIILAGRKRRVIHAALRINPDVDPKTHRFTTTGKRETKFGVDLERARAFFERFGRNEWVQLGGVHLHLGSPVNTIQPYLDAIGKALRLIDELRNAGFLVEMFDLGGGFGADYEGFQAPTALDYARSIVPLLSDRSLRIVLEPGRSISANAGILVTQVLYTKQSGEKQFVLVDAGMNDLIRPALYEAHHFVWPVVTSREPPAGRNNQPFEGAVLADVVGPVCESGDFLALDHYLPPVQRGDLAAIFACGAYGFSMSSQYNSRPRAAEILVEKDAFRVIRQRESYNDLISAEI